MKKISVRQLHWILPLHWKQGGDFIVKVLGRKLSNYHSRMYTFRDVSIKTSLKSFYDLDLGYTGLSLKSSSLIMFINTHIQHHKRCRQPCNNSSMLIINMVQH